MVSHTIPVQQGQRAEPASPSALIAELASAQHGIITFSQLIASGVSKGAIEWWSRHGRLHRVYHGVYGLGFMPSSRDARWMAAVLKVGDEAVLSHRCAAELWSLLSHSPRRIEIVSPRRSRGLPGVVVRESRTLSRDEVTRWHGLPVTSVSRTLVDLADNLNAYQLARIIHEAEFCNRFDLDATHRSMDRNRTRRGHSVLERALELRRSGSVGTRSDLEDRFLTLVREAGFEEPLVNTRVPVHGGNLEVDFYWPRARLCIEVDGSGHRRAATRRQDAERDASLRKSGMQVIRVSHHMLERRRSGILRLLARHRLGLARASTESSAGRQKVV